MHGRHRFFAQYWPQLSTIYTLSRARSRRTKRRGTTINDWRVLPHASLSPRILRLLSDRQLDSKQPISAETGIVSRSSQWAYLHRPIFRRRCIVVAGTTADWARLFNPLDSALCPDNSFTQRDVSTANDSTLCRLLLLDVVSYFTGGQSVQSTELTLTLTLTLNSNRNHNFQNLTNSSVVHIVYLILKFHDNSPITSWVILLANKRTETVRQGSKHHLRQPVAKVNIGLLGVWLVCLILWFFKVVKTWALTFWNCLKFNICRAQH